MDEKLLTWEEFKELSMNEKRTKDEWNTFLERKRIYDDYIRLQMVRDGERFSFEEKEKSLRSKIHDLKRQRDSYAESYAMLSHTTQRVTSENEYLEKENAKLMAILNKRTIWQKLGLKQ